jgi:hypothetical protein
VLLNNKFKPQREVKRAAREYVDIFLRWRTFGFPVVGGWEEQSAELIDAIDICKQAWDSVEREINEAEQQKANKASGKKHRRRVG